MNSGREEERGYQQFINSFALYSSKVDQMFSNMLPHLPQRFMNCSATVLILLLSIIHQCFIRQFHQYVVECSCVSSTFYRLLMRFHQLFMNSLAAFTSVVHQLCINSFSTCSCFNNLALGRNPCCMDECSTRFAPKSLQLSSFSHKNNCAAVGVSNICMFSCLRFRASRLLGPGARGLE